MLVGISLIGMITANLASLFIEPLAEGPGEPDVENAPTAVSLGPSPAMSADDARSLDERLAAIEQKLDALAEQLRQ